MSRNGDDFVSRWSRRKIAARSGNPLDTKPEPPVVPMETGAPPQEEAPVPLPPVESLTPESDFTAFMKPDVDAGVKRDALKVLMRDPRFEPAQVELVERRRLRLPGRRVRPSGAPDMGPGKHSADDEDDADNQRNDNRQP